jgi:hypothetical protein
VEDVVLALKKFASNANSSTHPNLDSAVNAAASWKKYPKK